MDNFGLFVSCFLKLFFVLKNKENKEKSVWFLFFFFLENIENTKFKIQEQFSKNTKTFFSMFSKT